MVNEETIDFGLYVLKDKGPDYLNLLSFIASDITLRTFDPFKLFGKNAALAVDSESLRYCVRKRMVLCGRAKDIHRPTEKKP